MLITLGLLVVAILFGGGSPFVIPKLDNYVKTHVVDDGRKKIVLEHLKDAKTKRKQSEKKNAKFIKELKKMLKSRETTREELELTIQKIKDNQAVSDEANIKANIEAQKNITSEEWKVINADIAKALKKPNKKANKASANLSKAYDKWKLKIAKTIVDKHKKEKAVAAAEKLRVVYLKNRDLIQKEVANKNSILYQYEASEEEVNSMQVKFMDLSAEVMQAAIETHFELVELTTEEEWKKIL